MTRGYRRSFGRTGPGGRVPRRGPGPCRTSRHPLHVADGPDTAKVQAHWLAGKLKDAGVSAKVVAAEGTTHETIGANLGKSGEPSRSRGPITATTAPSSCGP